MAFRTMARLSAVLLTMGVLLHPTMVTAACPPSTSFDQFILAPSYVYPCPITTTGCAWNTFSNGADIVIINPSSGPGTAVITDYANLVSSIRASTTTYITTILGYVATTYGAKSSANVKAEIDKYNSFYKVDGIFFDEVPTACGNASLYSTFVDYVRSSTKSPSGQDYTVFNWGTNGLQCFFQTPSGGADVFVTFEGPYSSYATYTPSTYMSSYPQSRFYHIVYDVSAANLNATITKSKTSRAGLVYATNDSGANPYDTAPSPASYWTAEVNRVAQKC